jgi:hypothetical protein
MRSVVVGGMALLLGPGGRACRGPVPSFPPMVSPATRADHFQIPLLGGERPVVLFVFFQYDGTPARSFTRMGVWRPQPQYSVHSSAPGSPIPLVTTWGAPPARSTTPADSTRGAATLAIKRLAGASTIGIRRDQSWSYDHYSVHEHAKLLLSCSVVTIVRSPVRPEVGLSSAQRTVRTAHPAYVLDAPGGPHKHRLSPNDSLSTEPR